MVMLIIIITTAAFLFQWVADLLWPGVADTWFALSREGISHGYYWQLVTYMFLHGGLLHLAVNCLGLYFAGREVETICGPRHFLALYFLGGIVGGAAQLLTGQDAPLVGASGGVCSVLMAFTTLLPELEITALIFFVIPIRMRAKWLGRALVVSSVFFAATGLAGDIGHIAHLGGAITGWFYARRLGFGGPFWFQRLSRDRRRVRERRAAMGPTQFISEEIDPILDKISREGIHSLTRAERRILELGRTKIARKTTRPF